MIPNGENMEPLKVFIIGGGAREHALVWKLSQSPRVERIYVWPGNAGTAQVNKTSNVSMDGNDFGSLVKFAQQSEINLVLPGPEQPLVDGIEGVFRKVGIPVFGPSALAARMEGSKSFSKDFMARHDIPTAQYKTFSRSQVDDAMSYLGTFPSGGVVLKADGLAGGKGVLIPDTIEEAEKGVRDVLNNNIFGDAGKELVIEERLTGPEISVLAFCDGYTLLPLPAAQDHKRIGDGDTGPNTGGMGAYAPAPVATTAILDQLVKECLQPTLRGMRREGFPFTGLLFTGFMLTPNGPKVLEYNVRFGDPETEALMMLLDQDLAEILLACVEHRLDAITLSIRPGYAVTVVLAAAGYPGAYENGKNIYFNAPVVDGVVIFHAGTKTDKDSSEVVTAGGRVLAVSAYASSLQAALDMAYKTIEGVHFDGMAYRRDIGHRALNTTQSSDAALTYAQAGVSVDAGNALVQNIKSFVRGTQRPGADAEIGGFGGVFDLKVLSPKYKDPVLVSGTDGVGTKLRVALDINVHDSVGIDLVAMSVNDLLVQGAEPLFFLDYYGCAMLNVQVASQVIKGIATGCVQAGCALIGGETAEMPGMYENGDYDLAGFAVGVVERHLILPQSTVAVGDVLVGVASSGIHSNGFSLVRKCVERSELDYSSPCPWATGQTLGQNLLTPTRIYIESILPLAQSGLVKSMSHITGGGFTENIPRCLPKDLGVYVDATTWPFPPVFSWIKSTGPVEAKEMCRTFNCGIGMVLIVESGNVEEVLTRLNSSADKAWSIGMVTATPGVDMRNLEAWNV